MVAGLDAQWVMHVFIAFLDRHFISSLLRVLHSGSCLILVLARKTKIFLLILFLIHFLIISCPPTSLLAGEEKVFALFIIVVAPINFITAIFTVSS